MPKDCNRASHSPQLAAHRAHVEAEGYPMSQRSRNTPADHNRRIRDAVFLLNEVLDAAEADGLRAHLELTRDPDSLGHRVGEYWFLGSALDGHAEDARA